MPKRNKAGRKAPGILRPKTLAEVFMAEEGIEPIHITLADLKAAVDAAVAEAPDGGASILLTTPTRINGMGIAYEGVKVFDPIASVRLSVMRLGGQECAVLDLGD